MKLMKSCLTRGTTLKREADKLSRSDPTVAAVTATHAILYFMSAFACDDQSRKLRGKLQLHENWKSTSEFIVWVINLQKDNNETELEGLWYVARRAQLMIVTNSMRYVINVYTKVNFVSSAAVKSPLNDNVSRTIKDKSNQTSNFGKFGMNLKLTIPQSQRLGGWDKVSFQKLFCVTNSLRHGSKGNTGERRKSLLTRESLEQNIGFRWVLEVVSLKLLDLHNLF
jgi:hypothetical protein